MFCYATQSHSQASSNENFRTEILLWNMKVCTKGFYLYGDEAVSFEEHAVQRPTKNPLLASEGALITNDVHQELHGLKIDY